MKRVLFVLEGGGVQEVVRGTMFRPLLKARGMQVQYVSRTRATPGSFLTAGGSRWTRMLASSLEWRAWQLVSRTVGTWVNHARIGAMVGGVDVVVLVKVRSLALVREIRRRAPRVRLVYDMGDALWLPKHANAYPDLQGILQSVDCVTTDNQFGVTYARQFNDNVALWPPTSQVELFDDMRGTRSESPAGEATVVLGWVGTPSTVFHLYAVWEALEAVFARVDGLSLRLVGVGNNSELVPPFERVRSTTLPQYSSQDMVREVLGMDVGLFPMFDTEDARVRGVLKALVYMAGEAAVVCSPRGECRTLIRDGENGFLAETREEWIDKLTLLVQDADLRRRLTAGGLATVRSRYTLEHSFEHLYAVLDG
jgi:glycosyltransferase involved in cell wall biosynthesis